MDPKVMDVIVKRCAGLDVHKEIIVACVRLMDDADKVRKSVRTFKTMTGDLRRMSAWMEAQDVTTVAMESTGVFWKPVFNVLEGHFDLLLCNAGHIKNVPGRKTDVKDSEWIAQLLQCGLLKGSFVPHRAQRDLLLRIGMLLMNVARLGEAEPRLARCAQLASEHTREANRIHKVLEDANVKISSVASEVLGKSGRAMLWALIEGRENPKQMAEHALGQLRGKIPQLAGHVQLQARILGHQERLYGPILPVALTPHGAAILQFHQRLQQERTIRRRPQCLPADVWQIHNRHNIFV